MRNNKLASKGLPVLCTVGMLLFLFKGGAKEPCARSIIPAHHQVSFDELYHVEYQQECFDCLSKARREGERRLEPEEAR